MKGSYKEILERLSQARSSLVEIEKMHNQAVNAISSAQTRINDAKNSGANVTKAEVSLQQARNAFQDRDYKTTIYYANQAENLAVNVGGTYLQTLNIVNASQSTLAEAKKAGINTAEAESLFQKAKVALATGDYDNAASLARQSYEIVERVKGTSKPEVSLEFAAGRLQINAWNRCSLTITNTGNTDARDIRFYLSGAVEVKGVEIISSLKAGEKKTFEIELKPNGVGDIPITTTITYSSFLDNRGYQNQGEYRLTAVDTARLENNLNILRQEIESLEPYRVEDLKKDLTNISDIIREGNISDAENALNLLDERIKDRKNEKQKSGRFMVRVNELAEKRSDLFVDDIKAQFSKGDFVKAEQLLAERKRDYERYLELGKGLREVEERTTKLSIRLAEGDLTSDAYERARDDLESRKKDIDEELWKIRRKIFREKYEKPF